MDVQKGSQAWLKGIRPGDEVTSINDGPARDIIDFLFYGSENHIYMKIRRKTEKFEVILDSEKDLGLEFEEMNVMTCGNHCLFCFIDQNPSGLRRELYIKDEDYRLSFLHGSYITLTTLKESDFQRIEEQHLSPLYLSVHATDTSVRQKLLGIRKDDDLLRKIDRLISADIQFHCQVVVCPGINDGNILVNTIHYLHERFPGILSTAIVPVGLTRYRNELYTLQAVDITYARKTIAVVDRLHDKFMADTGTGFVYCTDEWYIRAGYEVPTKEYYDDFPQYENGVGMVRDFLDSALNLEERIPKNIKPSNKFIFITGELMVYLLEDFSRRISEHTGAHVRTVAVKNNFFGDSITVSGLLTGCDIISALEGIHSDEIVVIPPNCLNESGVFIDDLSMDDIAGALGTAVVQGDYDPVETFKKLYQERTLY